MNDAADDFFAPPPGRRRFLVPLGMLLAGCGLGGGGAWFLSRPAVAAGEPVEDVASVEGAAAPSGEGHAATGAQTDGEARASPVDGSTVTSLGTFTVNLRGTGGGRVLRLEVQVEGPATQSNAVASRAAPIRDSIITAVSDYTWSELEGAGGKTRLRDELLARVNHAAPPSSIDRIYFTQFVVQ